MLNNKTLTPPFISKNLKKNLNGSKINIDFPKEILEGDPRKASVLIPLLHKEDGWHILFIRRTAVPGDFHSGQVAFPGGSQDLEDKNSVETALRETCEEIGVEQENIEVLGEMNKFLTISNFLVTPIIGVIPWPTKFIPSEKEVDRIFTMPLTWLSDKNNQEIKNRKLPNGVKLSVTYFKEFDGEILWGASAKILEAFMEVIEII